MSVRKLRNKWWVDIRHDFVRHRKKSPLNTREGALLYEATLRKRLAAGEAIDTPRLKEKPMTFAEFAREWFETYVKANNKPSEQENKACVLRGHLAPFFGTSALAQIDRKEIERYKARKHAEGLTNKTINNHLAVLGKALVCAEEWDQLERAPRIKLLRIVPPPVESLTDEECERLLADKVEPAFGAMVLVALRTGLRLGELLGLQWSDVDLAGRTITIQHSIVRGIMGSPKNHKIRKAPMDDDIADRLPTLPCHGPFVFHCDDGEPLTLSRALGGLTRLCRRAGIRRVTWHRLRHTFATQLCESRVPIRDVQALLGHSSLQMTQRYTHVRQENLASAVECLRERQRLPKTGQPVGNDTLSATLDKSSAEAPNAKSAAIATLPTW